MAALTTGRTAETSTYVAQSNAIEKSLKFQYAGGGKLMENCCYSWKYMYNDYYWSLSVLFLNKSFNVHVIGTNLFEISSNKGTRDKFCRYRSN